MLLSSSSSSSFLIQETKSWPVQLQTSWLCRHSICSDRAKNSLLLLVAIVRNVWRHKTHSKVGQIAGRSNQPWIENLRPFCTLCSSNNLIAVVSRNNKQVLILLGKWNKKKETAEHSILSSNSLWSFNTQMQWKDSYCKILHQNICLCKNSCSLIIRYADCSTETWTSKQQLEWTSKSLKVIIYNTGNWKSRYNFLYFLVTASYMICKGFYERLHLFCKIVDCKVLVCNS